MRWQNIYKSSLINYGLIVLLKKCSPLISFIELYFTYAAARTHPKEYEYLRWSLSFGMRTRADQNKILHSAK